MKHFVLTRFNEFFPDAFSSYWVDNSNLGLDSKWLKRRLRIFLNITFQTILTQSCKDFTWIVKCHYKTPTWVKCELKNIEKEINVIFDYEEYDLKYYEQLRFYHSLYECRYPSNRLICKLAFQNYIKDFLGEKILTTRLDSDDALAYNFIENVQNKCKINHFIDFEKGAILLDGAIFELHFPYKTHPSQFCSYLEQIKLCRIPKTVFFLDHTEANPCDYIAGIGWLQVNHNMCLNNHKIAPRQFIKLNNWQEIFKGVKSVAIE